MRKTVSFFFALAIGFASCAGFASDAAEKEVAAAFEKKLNVKPSVVRKTNVLGLYEVYANKRVFYVDKTARYLFAGHIIDIEKNKDITSESLAEFSRVKWETLPLKDAIKVVYGNGKRRVAVITDTHCTYCRLLEQALKQVGNVTVYNFMHPTERSRELSRRIVCAKDPALAFQNYMASGTEPKDAVEKCDSSSLDRNRALGRKLGIAGTPVIIFSDGSVQPGSLAPADLERRLNH